jgi:hypothetical protein
MFSSENFLGRPACAEQLVAGRRFVGGNGGRRPRSRRRGGQGNAGARSWATPLGDAAAPSEAQKQKAREAPIRQIWRGGDFRPSESERNFTVKVAVLALDEDHGGLAAGSH